MAANAVDTSIRQRHVEKEEHYTSNGHIKENGTISETKQSPTPPTHDPPDSSSLIDLLRIWSPIFLLIFGGCCTNVYALEALIHTLPSCGSLITAFQFLLTTLFTFHHHVSPSRGLRNFYLRERSIPFRKWLIYTAFFLTINILNNHAFKYRISVPLHIILRSAGPVTTMAVGRIFGQRTYSSQKIIGVLLLFIGVVYAAYSDAYAKQLESQTMAAESKSTSASTSTDKSSVLEQAPGFAIITLALLISAFMGLYSDKMYAEHGRSNHIASESLFYSHGLSLPYFLTRLPSLARQLSAVTKASAPLSNYVSLNQFVSPSHHTHHHHHHSSLAAQAIDLIHAVPISLPILLINAGTQYICISGVNRLSAKSSSLTVGIVLNIRKLVSLLLSIWLFGNKLAFGVMVGAALVFIGGGLYAWPTSTSKRKPKDRPELAGREMVQGTIRDGESFGDSTTQNRGKTKQKEL